MIPGTGHAVTNQMEGTMSKEEQRTDYDTGKMRGEFPSILNVLGTPNSQAGRDGYAAGLAKRHHRELMDSLKEAEQQRARERFQDELQQSRRLMEEEHAAREARFAAREQQRAFKRAQFQHHQVLADPVALADIARKGLARRVHIDALWFASRELHAYARTPFADLGTVGAWEIAEAAAGDATPRPKAPVQILVLATALAALKRGLLEEGHILPFENNPPNEDSESDLDWGRGRTAFDTIATAPRMAPNALWENVEDWMRLDAPFLQLKFVSETFEEWEGSPEVAYFVDAAELAKRRARYAGDQVWAARIAAIVPAIQQCTEIGLWEVAPRWLQWSSWEGAKPKASGPYGDFLADPSAAVRFIIGHYRVLLRAVVHGPAQAIADMHAATAEGIENTLALVNTKASLEQWCADRALGPVQLDEPFGYPLWINPIDVDQEELRRSVRKANHLRDLVVQLQAATAKAAIGLPFYKAQAASFNASTFDWNQLTSDKDGTGVIAEGFRNKALAVRAALMPPPFFPERARVSFVIFAVFLPLTLMAWIVMNFIIAAFLAMIPSVITIVMTQLDTNRNLPAVLAKQRKVRQLLDQWARPGSTSKS